MQRFSSNTNEMFTLQDLLVILKRLTFPHCHQILPATLNIENCINPSEKGRDLIRFFLESNLKHLTETEWNEIRQFLKDVSYASERGRELFYPVSITLVAREVSRLPKQALVNVAHQE